MIKRNYLALVSPDFNPQDEAFQGAMQQLNLNLEKHFPEVGIIKMSTFSNDGNEHALAFEHLPFVEHIEPERSVYIPPGEEEDN